MIDTVAMTRRALELGGDNPHAGVDYLIARSRIEGPDVLLEPLADRRAWNETPKPIQDLANREVERRMQGRIAHVKTTVYHYMIESQRLASYVHGVTGLIMHLIPGLRKLIGTVPISVREWARIDRHAKPTTRQEADRWLSMVGLRTMTIPEWAAICRDPVISYHSGLGYRAVADIPDF